MFKLFRSRQDKTLGTKILVASFSNAFAAEMEVDCGVYRRYDGSAQTRLFSEFSGIKEDIKGVDVLHLLASLGSEGQISTVSGEQFAPAALLDKCVASNVKAVVFANDNEANAYIRSVPAKPLNLVMTIARRGAAFPDFLDRLLCSLSSGVTFPLAWVKNAPQAPGSWHDHLPECIFAAGRPKAVLLP